MKYNPGGWNKAPIDDAEIVSRYLAGESGTSLAREHGVTCHTIYRRLRQAGIARRSNSASHKGVQAGDKNHNWRGGKSRDSAGYVQVSTGSGQVREHRIVASEMLGRPLLPGEVVHHKNGIRSDNRPENLEVHASHAEHMRLHMTTDEARRRGRRGLESMGYLKALEAR